MQSIERNAAVLSTKKRTAYFFVLLNFFLKVGNRNRKMLGQAIYTHIFLGTSVNKLFKKSDFIVFQCPAAPHTLRHEQAYPSA